MMNRGEFVNDKLKCEEKGKTTIAETNERNVNKTDDKTTQVEGGYEEGKWNSRK